MQFTTYVALALATAGFTMAAPAPAQGAVSMAAAVPDWTIEDFKRVCNSADTSCTYSFIIDTHLNQAPGQFGNCKYTVTGTQASRKAVTGQKCQSFTVTSGWSGQFGDDKGFTTFSVKRSNNVAYPSYTDAELASGKVVRPNRSYPVQKFTA